MEPSELSRALDRIVVAGVGLTVQALARTVPGFELTLPQWRVLIVLGQGSDGMTVTAIARRIGVTLPAMSRQLRRLERRALIAIAPDEDDRRASRVQLTDVGRETRTAVLEARQRLISALTDGVLVSAATMSELAHIADALGD